MSDTAEVQAQDTPAEQSSANVSTEAVIFRTYGAYHTDEKGAVSPVGVDDNGKPKPSAKPSTSRETKDSKSWKSQEEKGATLLSQNTYTTYTLVNETGFADLVPDAEQRVYIINKGLAAIQTAAVNAYQAETNDDGTLKYNDQSIDLRSDINEPPSRQVLTDEQKFMKAVKSMDQNKVLAMLEALKAQLSAS